MTSNLLNHESTIYISIHVGGHIYETAQRTVNVKQHMVQFDADFSIPILEEFLVSKAAPRSSDVSPTQGDTITVMPVTIRINRKGLIDSEIVAVGKMLIPIKSDLMDNFQVGLLTSEENTEIALASVSVQVHTITTTTPVIRIIMELEALMTQYARSEPPQADAILDSFQVYLTTCSTFCDVWSTYWSIITWRSYTKSLLFLVTVFAFPHGFVIAMIITLFGALVPSKSVPFLPYFYIQKSEMTEESLLQTNMDSLCQMMHIGNLFSNFIDQTRSELLFLACLLVAIIPSPIKTMFLVAMIMNTFWFEAIYNTLFKGRRRLQSQDIDSLSEYSDANTSCFTVYEQQRWWLAKWSDKVVDSFAWLDPTNPTDNFPRESFTLPPKSKWEGPWRVETSAMTDTDGWQYAQDFLQKFWTSKRSGIKDFVRRRKWVRKFVKE